MDNVEPADVHQLGGCEDHGLQARGELHQELRLHGRQRREQLGLGDEESSAPVYRPEVGGVRRAACEAARAADDGRLEEEEKWPSTMLSERRQ